MCAFDRIYYDTLNGQLKEKGEKWEGLSKTKDNLNEIGEFIGTIFNEECEGLDDPYLQLACKSKTFIVQNKTFLESIITGFKSNIKGKIKFSYFHDQYKLLDAFLKILSMIFYCLLSIVVTAAGVSMMFYACLKRQGYLITFMHVIWNIIRFFIVTFFLYGTAYGIFFLILKDLIACANKIFEEHLIKEKNQEYIFLHNCLFPDNTIEPGFTLFLDKRIKASIIYYFTSPYSDFDANKCEGKIAEENNKICNLYEKVKSETLGSFDCSFLQSDLNHLYKALYDASNESRYLSALCLCSSFFGAIAVYFYLLVIHHYNNEMFFDSGKSIFTGFDGFGRGYKRKNREQDPAYKKRKLRAEIELTSKNEEQDEYNDFKKNEDN